MSAALSLIRELEQAVQRGSQQKRVSTLQRVTSLFLDGVGTFKDEYVDVFDEVFILLIEEIERKARAELSARLAPVTNAPPNVLRVLAKDDDIAVAGPVLQLSPRLPETDLVDVAKTKSQAHLLAISARFALGPAVTDVLVGRGDREVARRIAGNGGARISEKGFSRLVRRAANDGLLAEKVGSRPDIPPSTFRELISQATVFVQRRLLVSAAPNVKSEVRQVLAKIAKEVGGHVSPRDYGAARGLVLNLSRAGRMNEATLAGFCSEGKYEEAVVGLAALAQVPINVVDRLVGSDRPDPALILCKAAALGWPTVKALLLSRPDRVGTSTQGIDEAFTNYSRLSASTAQKVVHFWRVRQD
jgi:uncharacterized protein (DUF2336 family)